MEDPEGAATVLFQAYDQFVAWKCRPLRALVCAWLSEALLGRGQQERALELAGEGLALSDELGVPLVAIFAGSKPGLTGPVGSGPIAVLGAQGEAPSVDAVIEAVAKIAR
jgi:hypothetical protein